MKTIRVRHGLGAVQTTDAAFTDDVGRIMAAIKNSLGLLEPGDLATVERVLRKYGSPNASTTQSGISSGDSLRADRDRQAAHTRTVAEGYRKFWDAANAERAASIIR